MGTPVSGRLRAFLPVVWKGSFALALSCWAFVGVACLGAGFAGGAVGVAGSAAEVAELAATSVRCCGPGA